MFFCRFKYFPITSWRVKEANGDEEFPSVLKNVIVRYGKQAPRIHV